MVVEDYFRIAGAMDGVATERRLRHQMAFLYENLDFSRKTVLDIGGGVGLHSLYACARGAARATIIEPEEDGGHDAMIATFNRLREALGLSCVDLRKTTIQAFQSPESAFDVVIIQDAINHFDESACISLHESQESRDAYDNIFRVIASLLKPGGNLMISDCSSKNMFPFLGMRNPFDPQIEWHKHQPPSIWAKLARSHGLELVDLRWSTPARFGSLGKVLFGSAIASWFFTSHFVATFQKVGPSSTPVV